MLVEHQRQNAGSCLCGWSELGKSHPAHQAAMVAGIVEEAQKASYNAGAKAAIAGVEPIFKEQAWDEGRKHGVTTPYGKRGLGTDDNPYRKRD